MPAAGYAGGAPQFPLPEPTDRELTLWALVWTYPQACAWSMPTERWRLMSIALYVRQFVRCEQPTVGAAHFAQLHRLADQIGLSTAGLADMGWKIVAETTPEPEDQPTRVPARRRLRAVEEGA